MWIPFEDMKIKVNNTYIYPKDVKNAKIHQVLNGDYRLSFDLPDVDGGFAEIIADYPVLELVLPTGSEEKFVVSRYKIKKDGTTVIEVEATQVFLEVRKCMVVSVDDMIGASVSYIVSEYWKNASLQGDNAIDKYNLIFSVDGDIGSDLIDFPRHENINFWDCLKDLIEVLGYGEIEIAGNKATLKRRVTTKVFPTLTLEENATLIERDCNISDTCTRAYVYGKNNLDLTSVIGRAYVDSSNIIDYGVLEKTYTFSDISDPQVLYNRALWLFDSDNPERVDVPSESITVSVVNLAFKKKLTEPYVIGGEVPFGDTSQRIVEMTYNLYEPQNLNITLGRMKTDLWRYLKRINGGENIKQIVNNTIKTSEVRNEIETVTVEKVVAAEVIEATAAFSENTFTDYLETNILPYVCTPNLKMDKGNPVWDTDETKTHYYSCNNTKNLRGFIVAKGISLAFKEQQLVTAENYSKLTTEAIKPFTVNGKQLYFTSVLGGSHPYEFFTFTDPKEKYKDMTTENAEMFKVYLRKPTAEFEKCQFEFTEIYNETYGTTYDVRLLFGTGSGDGDKGKAIVKKDGNGFYFSYVSRTDGVQRGVFIDDNNVCQLKGDRKIPIPIINITTDETEAKEHYNKNELYFVVK